MAHLIVLPDGYTLDECLNILRSPKPNETEMKKCIDAGVRLTVEECDDMCVPGNIVNGYVFNTCMEHHGITLYKYIIDGLFSQKKKYVNGKNVVTLPFDPSHNKMCSYDRKRKDALYFTDTSGIMSELNYNPIKQVYIVQIYSHSQVFLYENNEYTTNMFDLALDNPIPVETFIYNMDKNNILLMPELHMSRYIDHINPANINKAIFIKILSSHRVDCFRIKNTTILSVLEKIVRSLNPDDLIKMCIERPFCLYYLPKSMFTESFCKWIIDNVYPKMQTLYKDIYFRRVLEKQMDNNDNMYSDKFIIECITKYGLSNKLLPATSITLEVFTELCKHKSIVKVYKDARFEKFITKEACIENIKSQRVSFKSIPDKFKTQSLKAIQNKCDIAKIAKRFRLDKTVDDLHEIYLQEDNLLDTFLPVDDTYKIHI
jgi:hypothetical protein